MLRPLIALPYSFTAEAVSRDSRVETIDSSCLCRLSELIAPSAQLALGAPVQTEAHARAGEPARAQEGADPGRADLAPGEVLADLRPEAAPVETVGLKQRLGHRDVGHLVAAQAPQHVGEPAAQPVARVGQGAPELPR